MLFLKANQIITWNELYLGVASQWNAREQLQALVKGSVPLFFDSSNEILYFVDKMNVAWKF